MNKACCKNHKGKVYSYIEKCVERHRRKVLRMCVERVCRVVFEPEIKVLRGMHQCTVAVG